VIRSRAVINWQALKLGADANLLGISRHVQNQWRLREIAPPAAVAEAASACQCQSITAIG
jgi:hypothetical protein